MILIYEKTFFCIKSWVKYKSTIPRLRLHIHVCLLRSEGDKSQIWIAHLYEMKRCFYLVLDSSFTWDSPIWNSEGGSLVLSRRFCWLQFPPILNPPWQLLGTKLEQTLVPFVLESFLHWVTLFGEGFGLNLPTEKILKLIIPF